jgi:PAS domain-containing protein
LSIGLFITLTITPLARLSPVAIAATTYFALYLGAGAIDAIVDQGSHDNLLIYLIWFFALLAFNQFVNASRPSRILGSILLCAPLTILVVRSPRLIEIFSVPLQSVLIVYCPAYIACAFMLNAVWRYREAFIEEQERFATIKAASQILESIADGFYTLDRDWRFTYFNRAAELLLRRSRDGLIGKKIWDEFPDLARSGWVGKQYKSPVIPLWSNSSICLSRK